MKQFSMALQLAVLVVIVFSIFVVGFLFFLPFVGCLCSKLALRTVLTTPSFCAGVHYFSAAD